MLALVLQFHHDSQSFGSAQPCDGVPINLLFLHAEPQGSYVTDVWAIFHQFVLCILVRRTYSCTTDEPIEHGRICYLVDFRCFSDAPFL